MIFWHLQLHVLGQVQVEKADYTANRRSTGCILPASGMHSSINMS